MTDLPMPTVPRPDASVRAARRGDAAGLAAVTLASWRGQYAEVLPVAATELTEAELEQRWADALAATPVRLDGSTASASPRQIARQSASDASPGRMMTVIVLSRRAHAAG